MQFIQKFMTARAVFAGFIGAALALVNHFQTIDVTKFSTHAMSAFDFVLAIVSALVTLGIVGSAHAAPQPAPKSLKGPAAGGLVMLVALVLGGCNGGYLTPARGPSQKLAASPELSEYCEKLDRKVFRATVATYIGAGLAGGAVVPALVADDKAWLYAGAATGAAGAITGLVATPIKVQSEKRFQARCQ